MTAIPESVTEVYLVDEKDVLKGVVPLARLVMALPENTPRGADGPTISFPATRTKNRTTWRSCSTSTICGLLPVVDSAQRLVGIIQADHVIAFLRQGR